MANHNPNLEGLNEGRGKRPRLNNDTVAMRMSSETKEILTRIAVSYGAYTREKDTYQPF